LGSRKGLSHSPVGGSSLERWLQGEHLGGYVRVSVWLLTNEATRWRVSLATAAIASRL